MTREELMEDIEIGQIIKIYTTADDIVFGKVDSFGPSGLKIIQLGNNSQKRIMYERISEYDIDVDEKDYETEKANISKSEEKVSLKIDRATIFDANRIELSSDFIMESFEKQIEKKDKNSYSSIQNIIDYAKKIGEYKLDSDRVKRAIAQLQALSKQFPAFCLYIAAILYDFSDFESSAKYCFECENYELAFYLYDKLNNEELMFKSALLSADKTKDEYIIKWLCEYAVKINNAHIIKILVSKNEMYANKALVYWFADSPLIAELDSIEQAYLDVNIKKMKNAINEIGDDGREILSFVYERQAAKKKSVSKDNNEVETGTISFYDKHGRFGYIKRDCGGSLYFNIRQVKDYNLQKILLTGAGIKRRVSYIDGINYQNKAAADCIEMIEDIPIESDIVASKCRGHIAEYDKHSEYGRISYEGRLYNFTFNAILDPLLLADMEYSYEDLDLDVEFSLKTRINKSKQQEETVACDIIGLKEYSDEEIKEWIRYNVISKRDVDAWLNHDNTQEDVTWLHIPYEPLPKQKKKNAKSNAKQTPAVPFDDQEENICNELIKDIENPFLSMEKIADDGNYREQALKCSVGVKKEDNDENTDILKKAEELFIKALQADEQVRSTVPDLVNVYFRLGDHNDDYIIKGLQLLSVYGKLLSSETLMHLRIQLIEKYNDKTYLERILENSIKKCTKDNTRYHFMSRLAGLYLQTEKYEKASESFKQCVAFLEENKNKFDNYEKMTLWLKRSIIIADYYAGDKEGAIKQAKEFLDSHPDDPEASAIKSIAEGTVDETKKDEILDDIMDDIMDDSYGNMNPFFQTTDLPPYFSYRLEECDYSRVTTGQKKQDEKTGKWIWNPKTVKEIDKAYKELVTRSSLFRRGEFLGISDPDISERRLNMTKIAEYCLKKQTELDLNAETIGIWQSRFICTAAQCMWLLYKQYSVGKDSIEDTSSYYLLECISIFFKDENYRFSYEFFDAVNSFCIIQSKLQPSDFTQIKIKGRENLNFRKAGRTHVDKEIAQMECIVVGTFEKIFESDPKSAIKTLGRILESCNKKAVSYFSRLLSPIEDLIKNELPENASDEHDEYSLEKVLADYARKLSKNYDKLLNDLDDISEAIKNLDLIRLDRIAIGIENSLKDDKFVPLSDSDVSRCETFIGQIQTLIRLKNTSTDNYDIAQKDASSLISDAERLPEKLYKNHPTRVSHDRLTELMPILGEAAQRIIGDIIQKTSPEITVENELGEEGCCPQNERIDLMLLIRNGKSGRYCRTASKIQLDIEPDETLRKYVNIEKTSYTVSDSLPFGGREHLKIDLRLTSEGLVPDTVFPMTVKVSYSTSEGGDTSVCEVFNIRIQSEDAFVKIHNPYVLGAIDPHNKEMFRGRATDVANISNILLTNKQGQTVLIYGQYRSGKTSLSNFLVREIESQDKSIITVKTSLTSDNPWQIINKITTNTYDVFDDLNNVPEYMKKYSDSLATADNYERVFTKFAKELDKLRHEQNLHFLIVIDEFGRFLSNDLSRNFMQLWKSVMELGVFNAILIGHDIVTQIMRTDANSFGIINPYPINYIDRDAAHQLITEPTRMKDNRSRFTEDAIHYIWEQSAGNVWYIQLICKCAVIFMNKRRINVLNEVYVKQAIKEVLNNATIAEIRDYGHPLFQSGEIGENATTDNEAKIVLDAITRRQNDVSEEEIIRLSMERYGQSEIVTKKVLNSLRERRVVDQDKDSGNFSIRCSFYPDFLNDHIIQDMEEDRNV